MPKSQPVVRAPRQIARAAPGNRMILGDSLLVMNSLAETEDLKGQVQLIYLAPPLAIAR
jgi:hypothetical protein